jgi:hypothetical protein
MTIASRYHVSVVRCFLVIAVFSLWAVALQAQINGPRPSVTSLGGAFNVSNPPGPRASVTSLGPNGWGRGSCCQFPRRGPSRTGFGFDNRHHRGDGAGWAGGYPLYVMPYYYPMDVIDPVDTSMEESYAPGPTIFDRRGSDQSSGAYEQRMDERLSRLEQQIDEAEQAKPSKPAAEAQPAIPARDQPDTILVFRDGHTLTVKNYVILGDTLYDYSSDVRRKIDLANLDVAATQKKNDDQGVDFRLPAHVATK